MFFTVAMEVPREQKPLSGLTSEFPEHSTDPHLPYNLGNHYLKLLALICFTMPTVTK